MLLQVKSSLDEKLKEIGLVLLDENQPPPPDLIEYGKIELASNQELTFDICNHLAEQTEAIWTYKKFKASGSMAPEKPEAPSINDPRFEPPKEKVYAKHLLEKYPEKQLRAVETALAFNQANHAYKTALKSYQELRVQIRAVHAVGNLGHRGYLDFVLPALQAQFPDFVQGFFFTPKRFFVNEEARKKHTFITGGTGSGKSETMKTLIHHYLTANTEPAVVVMDPHGDFARDVARFEVNQTNDRLVYISPGSFNGHHVSFNPFDFKFQNLHQLNVTQLQFRGALEQMLGQALTLPQKALLTPCLAVMLQKEGTTLKDLLRLMDDERNGDLVKFGATQLANENDRAFFKNQFHARNFESTKEALSYRLAELVRDPAISEFLCNPSTFDLEASLQNGNLVVFNFNPSKMTEESITTIGQLLSAYMVSFAMQRPQGDRRPIHLFADECQYFVNPTYDKILGEARKFGLYLTMATQRTEQAEKTIDAIFGNVGCYMTGRNKSKTAEKMAKELQIKADEIRDLRPLEFFQTELDRQPIKTKIPVIGHRLGMDKDAWLAMLKDQRTQYYQDSKGHQALKEAQSTLEEFQSNQAPDTANIGLANAYPLPS